MAGLPQFSKLLTVVVKNVLILIVCIFVWIVVLLPLFVVPFCILWVIRKFADFLVLRLHRSYKPIHGIEALYAVASDNNYSDKKNHCFANGYCGIVVDGQVSAQQYRQAVESTLFLEKGSQSWSFWKLSSKPVKVYGYYYWKPLSSIKLEEYVKEGPEQLKDFDLDKILNEWMPIRFNGDRSPWEVMVLHPQNGTLKGKSVILIKGSHLLFDAVGTRDFILTTLHTAPEPHVIPPVIQQGWWISAFHFLTVPRLMLDAWLDLLSSKWSSNSGTIYNGRCNNGDSTNAWGTVDVSLVKQAKRKLGCSNCSFKDVLVCATGSALQNHMLTSGMKLPGKVSVLLNTHWPHAEHPGNLAVNATSILAPFKWTEFNPKKQIAKFHTEVQAKMSIGSYKFNYYSSHLLHLLPSFVISSAGQWNLFRAYAVTDIPFTTKDALHLMGNPVTAMHASASLQGVPFLVVTGFITLGSKLCVSFAANKLFIESQQAMEEVMQAFKKELIALATFADDDYMLDSTDKNSLLTDVRICEA